MSITEVSKAIAKTALNVFGGKPAVAKYWDDNNYSSVDILTTANRPFNGVASYSTLLLSDYSIDYTVEGKPLCIEIVGASATAFEFFPNILSTCAFNIINSKASINHGEVFKNIINMYYPESEMKYVLFTSPFLWEELSTLDFPNKKVAWLLAVPISSEELLFAEENGTETLEDLFEQNDIDIFDLNRNSVL